MYSGTVVPFHYSLPSRPPNCRLHNRQWSELFCNTSTTLSNVELPTSNVDLNSFDWISANAHPHSHPHSTVLGLLSWKRFITPKADSGSITTAERISYTDIIPTYGFCHARDSNILSHVSPYLTRLTPNPDRCQSARPLFITSLLCWPEVLYKSQYDFTVDERWPGARCIATRR